MSAYYGWERGQVCNYHQEPNGPVTMRGCVLMEDPVHVPALGGVFVMLDKVEGLVPFHQISSPTIAGRAFRQLSLLPDLVLAGLRLKNRKAIPSQYAPNNGKTARKSTIDPQRSRNSAFPDYWG